MNVIRSANVTVYAGEFGFYTAGITRRLDCDNMEFANTEYFNPSAKTIGDCMQVLPAGAVIDNSQGAIKVAKIKLPGKGFIWIAFTDYVTLTTACNRCCGT